MTGIQLTYDSRQDRLLLQTGMDVAMPNWWLTRREVRQLLKAISRVTTAQYETEKLLGQLAQNSKPSQAKSGLAIGTETSSSAQTYREFHKKHSGDTLAEMARMPDVEGQPEQYPLAWKINIDLSDEQGIKLFLLNAHERGACLEFTQEGLYRFNNMLFTVAQKAQWF